MTNPNPASAAFVIRQFSIVQRDAAGTVTGVQNPVCRDRYQDERRHTITTTPCSSVCRAGRQWTVGERPVHDVAQLRQHQRIERSVDGRQCRPDAGRISTTTSATTPSTCVTRSTSARCTRCRSERAGVHEHRESGRDSRRLGRRRHRQCPQRPAD